MRREQGPLGRAAAAAGTVALVLGFPAAALAADSARHHSWGKDVVQTGKPNHFGGHEWCYTHADCQAGGVGDLGGEFGAGGPTGVALSGVQGYVVDPANHRIQVFENLGRYFIAAWGKDVIRAGRSYDTGAGAEVCVREFDCQAGVPGALGGELNGPTAVAVDSGGNVYVADAGNRRVQKFSSAGVFISAWGKDVVQGGGTGDEVCTVASNCQAGAAGTGLGEFTTLTGIAAGGGGQVFVADDRRIQRFDTSGAFPLAWGSPGTLGGQFAAGDLGVALQGSVLFVTDPGNHRVQKFDTAGVFQQAWGKGVDGGGSYEVCTAAGTCQVGSVGFLGGEMNGPVGVAADSVAVYVVETLGQRVQKFDLNGVWNSAWGRDVQTGTPGFGTCTAAANCLPGTEGALGGEFDAPQGIAVQEGPNPAAWVGNAGDGRVEQFGGGAGATTFTSSYSGHRYDVYYGTLSLSRPGGGVYRTREAFASQIRVSQAAANDIAADVGSDLRVSGGFAGIAPDGGSWITNRPDPEWWDRPNGASAPLDQPTFDAQGLFLSSLAAEPQLAAGESAACSDSASVARSSGQEGVGVVESIGPDLIFTGPDRGVRFLVRAGTVNYNDDTSFLLIDAHRRDRSCIVPAVPPVAGGAAPAPDPPSADLAAANRAACLSIPGVVRDQRASAPGGGKLTLQTRQVDDPASPLRTLVKLSGSGKIKSVVFKVNGRTVKPATGARASAGSTKALAVPQNLLSLGGGKGKRNKITATVTLANGKRIVLTQFMVVLKCTNPATKCTRLADPKTMRCTSKTPLGGRRVRVTVSRTTRDAATGSATVKKGKYTTTVRSPVALSAGTYAYKHVVSTAKPRQRYFMIRRVAVR